MIAVGFALGELHVSVCGVVAKACPNQSLRIAETPRLGADGVALILGATLGGDDHRPRQGIIAKEVGSAPLNDLDRLDIIEVDVHPTGALKHRHPVDHHGHAGFLTHVDLILDTTDMDFK